MLKEGKSTDYGDSGFSNDTPYKRHPCKAVSSVIGGFIYMLFPGCLYCTGVFATYI